MCLNGLHRKRARHKDWEKCRTCRNVRNSTKVVYKGKQPSSMPSIQVSIKHILAPFQCLHIIQTYLVLVFSLVIVTLVKYLHLREHKATVAEVGLENIYS